MTRSLHVSRRGKALQPAATAVGATAATLRGLRVATLALALAGVSGCAAAEGGTASSETGPATSADNGSLGTDQTSADANVTTDASGSKTIKITGMTFPDTVTITKGQTVTWHNASGMGHTISEGDAKTVAKKRVFDSGDLPDGQSFSHTFDKAGTFPYVCIYHAPMGMTGKIVVKDPPKSKK
jgi:plastocyanin